MLLTLAFACVSTQCPVWLPSQGPEQMRVWLAEHSSFYFFPFFSIFSFFSFFSFFNHSPHRSRRLHTASATATSPLPLPLLQTQTQNTKTTTQTQHKPTNHGMANAALTRPLPLHSAESIMIALFVRSHRPSGL